MVAAESWAAGPLLGQTVICSVIPALNHSGTVLPGEKHGSEGTQSAQFTPDQLTLRRSVRWRRLRRPGGEAAGGATRCIETRSRPPRSFECSWPALARGRHVNERRCAERTSCRGRRGWQTRRMFCRAGTSSARAVVWKKGRLVQGPRRADSERALIGSPQSQDALGTSLGTDQCSRLGEAVCSCEAVARGRARAPASSGCGVFQCAAKPFRWLHDVLTPSIDRGVAG